jgi:CheY-like chemotaxis protein
MYRAFIFEDDENVRNTVTGLLRERGYEVLDFANPGLCPLYEGDVCRCLEEEACGDIAISDVNMGDMSGFDFIERQKKIGCKLPKIALMSGAWSESDLRCAEALGCKIFHKPFTFDEIHEWLDECERVISPNRVLANWFKEPKISRPKKLRESLSE